jgi:squalene-hopene/tetraprenyl-beta-curcumene cyclase
LHHATKAALDTMWDIQTKTGAWNWLKCDWPPLEHDDFYGATLAALATGYAPVGYAQTEKAQAGRKKLRAYLTATAAVDLHHTAMLLWASTKLPDLMSDGMKAKAVAALKAKQRKDGGWSLPSLGAYTRPDEKKTPNDPDAASDGDGTGFVTFVLLQAGEKPTGEPIKAAVTWLKANQRESGRWFTRSLNNDKAHYITNAGTAFCVLALSEGGVLASTPGEGFPKADPPDYRISHEPLARLTCDPFAIVEVCSARVPLVNGMTVLHKVRIATLSR